MKGAERPEPDGGARAFLTRTIRENLMLASFLMGLVGGQRSMTPLAAVAVAAAGVGYVLGARVPAQVTASGMLMLALRGDTELDEWQKRAQDALTGQARTEFDETLKAQRELITQTKTGAECRVDAIGVRDLSGADDGATATVIGLSSIALTIL